MAIRILKEDIAHEQVATLMRDWGLVLQPPPDAPEDMFWQVWKTADQESAIEYIDDAFTKVHSFFTRGNEEESLAERITEALPVWHLPALLGHAYALLDGGSEAALQRVAYEIAIELEGNGFDPESAECLNAFLQAREPSTRLAGATAFAVLTWRKFRLMAERVAADADPSVAEVGESWLAAIREEHGDTPPNPMAEMLFDSNGDGTFGAWLPSRNDK